MAAKNGMTTVEMAEHYATLGVKYGDVLALIEAAGRRAIDTTIAELARLKAAAAAPSGGGGGGGVDSGRFTSGGSGGGDFYSSEIGGAQDSKCGLPLGSGPSRPAGLKGLRRSTTKRFLPAKIAKTENTFWPCRITTADGHSLEGSKVSGMSR